MNGKGYVSLEVAKLLRKMGFNEDCEYMIEVKTGYSYVCEYDHIRVCNSSLPKGFISLPTFYKVQEWLREEYDCYIQITHEAYKTGVNYLVQVLFYESNDDDCWSNKSSGKYGDNAEFKTYEEALNFGILEALKRI